MHKHQNRASDASSILVFYLLFSRQLIVEDNADVFQHGHANGDAVVF